MNASTTPLLVVELGNPRPKYKLTRHNVGHLVLDGLANRTSPIPSSFSVHEKSNAEIMQARLKTSGGGERQVILAKPRTYMNLSGELVAALTKFSNVTPTDVVVAHDELDLNPGVMRFKHGGGENGHNGLRSISKSLGTKDYIRVRIGISRPPGHQDPADYVLRNFDAKEREELVSTLPIAAEAVELVTSHGLETAQDQIHEQ